MNMEDPPRYLERSLSALAIPIPRCLRRGSSFYAALCAAALLIPTVASAGPIQHRQANQQQRIYKGVQNGSLTGKEYRNLQRREQSIAAQRYRDVHDGGGLTAYERQRLNNRLNNTSQAIYREKHD